MSGLAQKFGNGNRIHHRFRYGIWHGRFDKFENKLRSQSIDIKGFKGGIARAITAESDLEAVTEKVLGADLFGVFVEDEASAEALALQLKDQDLGEISIVPLKQHASTPKRPTTAPKGTYLIEHLTYEKSYAAGIEALLGDVVLVEDLASAFKLAATQRELRFVTRDGLLVWPGGKVTEISTLTFSPTAAAVLSA